MKVTVDINVLLDVFQKREPHVIASSRILHLITTAKLEGVIPSHGITTLYYLVRKHTTKADAETALDRVLAHFAIGNLDPRGWHRARFLAMPDFEDAVVAATAESTGSAYVVTRNLDDFTNSPVPAISPDDLLGLLASMP